jgi:tetratricopeptide (TPR) repeat protein
MKKQLLALTLGFLSMVTFAQKNELKAVEKAIKKGQFKEAKTTIATLEATEDAIEPKLKAKYYFLKGAAYGKSNVAKAAAAYNKLIDYEKETGTQKYSKLAAPKLNDLIQYVSNQAIEQYNAKNYKQATNNFILTYALSPRDTTFLYNAAVSASLDKDYDTSLKHYIELKKLGYKGVTQTYFAVNQVTGKEESFQSKQIRDLSVKAKSHIKPTVKVSESKQADIIKNIGYIYINQEKPELAIAALEEARKSNPKDINLLLNQAQMYIELKRMDKFGELMEEAVTLDPTNPNLFFNLGVVNANQNKVEAAKNYYKKAIELKPDYADAYMNLSITILSGEKAIIDEMNKNFSNAKKYNALEKQQKALYNQALPYLVKGDELGRNIETVRTLMNIYDTLEMTDKADELRVVYKQLRNQ